jgi:hypothetical protein
MAHRSNTQILKPTLHPLKNKIMLFERIIRYLNRNNIDYNVVRDNAMVDFLVETRRGAWEITITVFEEERVCLFHSVLLDSVPQHLRREAAIYLNELNQSRAFGNFEMSTDEGEVRFKTYLDCRLAELTPKSIKRSLMVNVLTMQKHFPTLAKFTQQRRKAEAPLMRA